MSLSRRFALVLALALVAAGGTVPAASASGLPFGQSMAQGHELPLPLGVGLTYYNQNQPYKIDKLEFALPGVPAFSSDVIDVQNRITEADVQLDAWLLPYMNVFVMVGNIDGHTDVDLSRVNLGLPFSLGSLSVNYKGTQYGGGMTLAAGGQAWFASVTGVWTKADLGGDFDSSVNAMVIMPRFGIGNAKGSVWLGAMYQQADEHHKGVFNLPILGAVPFDVELSQKDDWNGLVGAHTNLATHWTLELEGGWGQRQTAAMTVAYRF